MRKIITTLVALTLIVLFCIPAFASDNHDIGDSSNIEVIPPDDCTLTDIQKQNITNHLMGNENEIPTITTFSIICTLFGHDLTVQFWKVIQHKYYDNTPRCLSTYYDVSICSRCDYVRSTWVSDARLPCCD